MEIEVKKIKDLKPNPLNPRKSSITQDENLKKSLEKFGVVEPIVFNKQSGYIVGGHFRVRELKKLGYKEVECVIVDLSPDDEKELLIRLNANTGDWDTDLLLQDWDGEQLGEWGLEIERKIDNAKDNEEIKIEKSVQIEPPKEYILIMAEPNSEEWEELKNMLKLKMVRRGGYKKGSAFDAVGIERVIKFNDFKKRINANCDTK
jgi:hypothetical protein